MRTNKLAELIGENGEIPFSIISAVTVVLPEFEFDESSCAGKGCVLVPSREKQNRIFYRGLKLTTWALCV